MATAALPLALVVAAPLGAQTTAAAQEPAAPDALCFSGGPRARCGTFVVVEMEGVFPLVRDTRSVRSFGGYTYAASPFEERLQWELGLMHNLSDAWALGATLRLGAGSVDALTGVAVRGRRWLTPDVGLDLAAGPTFVEVTSGGRYGRATGVMADARVNLQDDAWVGVRFERVSLDAFHGPDEAFDPGGSAHAVSAMVGLGSEWAVAGTAALGLWFAILVASVGFD